MLIPVTGHTIEAELEAGAQGTLWIHELRAATGERIVSRDLVAVLKLGWRIVNASPDGKRYSRHTGSGAAGRRDAAHGWPVVTVAVPATGETFDAQLDEDEFHMLWLNEPNRKGRRMGRDLLSAVLRIGWRIASASPEEQALRDAHGFGSGRVQ